MTASNINLSALLALCEGSPPVTGGFPSQRPMTRSFDVFFDLHLNKRVSKQSWDWRFETPSLPLWRHCNERKHFQSCHQASQRKSKIWTTYFTRNHRNIDSGTHPMSIDTTIQDQVHAGYNLQNCMMGKIWCNDVDIFSKIGCQEVAYRSRHHTNIQISHALDNLKLCDCIAFCCEKTISILLKLIKPRHTSQSRIPSALNPSHQWDIKYTGKMPAMHFKVYY